MSVLAINTQPYWELRPGPSPVVPGSRRQTRGHQNRGDTPVRPRSLRSPLAPGLSPGCTPPAGGGGDSSRRGTETDQRKGTQGRDEDTRVWAPASRVTWGTLGVRSHAPERPVCSHETPGVCLPRCRPGWGGGQAPWPQGAGGVSGGAWFRSLACCLPRSCAAAGKFYSVILQKTGFLKPLATDFLFQYHRSKFPRPRGAPHGRTPLPQSRSTSLGSVLSGCLSAPPDPVPR